MTLGGSHRIWVFFNPIGPPIFCNPTSYAEKLSINNRTFLLAIRLSNHCSYSSIISLAIQVVALCRQVHPSVWICTCLKQRGCLAVPMIHSGTFVGTRCIASQNNGHSTLLLFGSAHHFCHKSFIWRHLPEKTRFIHVVNILCCIS